MCLSRMTRVLAKPGVSVESLRGHLHDMTTDDSEDLSHLEETLVACANMLVKVPGGGTMMVILDKKIKHNVQLRHTDGGRFTSVCRQHAPNVVRHPEQFETLLAACSAHSPTDRWSADTIEALVENFGEDENIRSLQDDPSLDGAFVLSWRGTMMAANARIYHTCDHYHFVLADGTSAGARHRSGLGVAEWMGSQSSLGAVLVRSDAGSVHAIISNGTSAPVICQVAHPEIEPQAHIVLTIDVEDRFDDRVTLSCTNIAGIEVARVHMDPSGEAPIWLRSAVAKELSTSKHKIMLLSSDGGLAPRTLAEFLESLNVLRRVG